MAYTKLNRSAATLTKNRTEGSISPFSGMCVTCVDGCIGMCEIGKSAYRGQEVLYPQPFGLVTAASEKEYPVDLSHFTILGTAAGAVGVKADSDHATFEKVDVETAVGKDKGIKLKVPFVVPGMGSTNVAKNNWRGLGTGVALAGGILTVGENVCAMDNESTIENGKVVFPVKGLTIAGTAFDMLNGLDMLGNDLDMNRGLTAPTFRIKNLQIGGE